jgi:hypothetical protein
MSKKSNQISPRRKSVIYLLVLKLSKYLKLNTIVYLPVLLSGVIFLIGSLIVIQVYPNGAPLSFTGTLLLIMFIIASLSGFIQISIEEVPGLLLPVHGKAAKVFGILWIAFFWLMAICSIWYCFL